MSKFSTKKNITKDKKSFFKNFTDFCKKNSVLTYISIGIPLFFLSIMLVAQMKTISKSDEIIKGKRETELAEELLTLQRNYDDLKKNYDNSQKIVNEYKTNSATNDELIASMQRDIKNLNTIAGTTALKGEGIIITMSDGEVKDGASRTDALVHDSDILTVVNELKAAGAEAISVNGQRIISTSAIRCVGPVIQVNYKKVASPFEIKAIGNAQYLESAMTIKNGVVDLIKEYGEKITISREKEITIPKYDGTINLEKSTVVE